MAKIRVYELARDLGVESKVLLAKMKTLKIDVPSHQSTLTPAQIEKIRATFVVGKAPVVVRRRKKEEEPVVEVKETQKEVHEPKETKQSPPEPVVPEIARQTPPTRTRKHEAPKTREPEVPVQAQATTPVSEEPESEVKAKKAHLTEAVEEPKTQPKPKEEEPVLTAQDLPDPVEEKTQEKLAESVSEEPKTEPLVAESESAESAVIEKVEEQHGGKPSPDLKEKGTTMKAETIGLPKRKDFVSATIIRRATPEEEALSKSKEDNKILLKAKINRVEMQPIPSGRIPLMAKKPSIGGPVGPNETFKIVAEPPSRIEKLGTERRKEIGGKTKAEEIEEEKPIAAKALSANKRRSVSTRELLEAVGREDEDIELYVGPKRRTVYTPNSAQKKKDAKRRKDLKSTQLTTPRAAYRVVKMTSPTILVSDLAMQMSVKATEIVKHLVGQGIMVTANQTIDFESASLVASEYGFECKRITRSVEDILGWEKEEHFAKSTRPPIVTVMGHVDHGKTTILDSIRKADVANREAGGITQHIGAYTVERNGFKIAFLDTPGHEAFSAMRARGAHVTDIIVLVVAADDGVMPQTIEAIAHAKKAGVPIIVAVNKIDKQNVNFDRVYTELSEQGVQTEEWGGEVQCIKVSAKKMIGIDELLEAIQIQAEMLELKARKEGRAKGIVIEAHLDKGHGAIATVMVTEGVLNIGEFIVMGKVFGRVRAMLDHNGKTVKHAYPSTPVKVIGLTEVPMAGDYMHVALEEKAAREVVEMRRAEDLEAIMAAKVSPKLEDLLSRSMEVQLPELILMIKADTQGSAEAIAGAIANLRSAKIRINIIMKAVGDINESDLHLAETSGAAIVAFNVKASKAMADKALDKGINLKQFSIIYELIDAVKELMVKKLPPVFSELVLGHAEVRNTISVPKIGLIAGVAITDGKVTRQSLLRVTRNAEIIHSGKISSLKRFKDDVKEVVSGFECGIGIDSYNNIEIGDILEAYIVEEKPAELDI